MQATDCRSLICFFNIHRMFKKAKYATARKSPGRTAVAGNRLPPVDLLFDRSPDGRNDALRHRKSTPLRVQEAGTSPSNEIKRIGACLSVLFGLGEKIRTSGLGADFHRLRSGGRPLSDFQTIHRMVWIANNATVGQPLLGFKRPELLLQMK